MAETMPSPKHSRPLDEVLNDLEKATVELARSVAHRDPSFADHIHARAEAVQDLQHCNLCRAQTGQLTRLHAVLRLGAGVEHSIRQWRETVLSDLAGLGSQSELARTAKGRDAAGAILDITM